MAAKPVAESKTLFDSLGASMVHSVFVQTGAIPPVKLIDRPVFKSFFDGFSGRLTFGTGLKWMVKAWDRNVHMYVTVEPNNLYSVWALTTTDEYNNGESNAPIYRLLHSTKNVERSTLESSVMGAWSKAIRGA